MKILKEIPQNLSRSFAIHGNCCFPGQGDLVYEMLYGYGKDHCYVYLSKCVAFVHDDDLYVVEMKPYIELRRAGTPIERIIEVMSV